MSGGNQAFFTIGHSTRPIERLTALLRGSEIKLVADVRTVPRSRANPQYDGKELDQTLPQLGIGYRHWAA